MNEGELRGGRGGGSVEKRQPSIQTESLHPQPFDRPVLPTAIKTGGEEKTKHGHLAHARVEKKKKGSRNGTSSPTVLSPESGVRFRTTRVKRSRS